MNNTQSKPRICQLLGVEVGERFRVEIDNICLCPQAFVDEGGIVRAGVGAAMNAIQLCQLINGELRLIRRPQFTPQEAEDARQIMRLLGDPTLYACRDEGQTPFLTDRYDRLCIELGMDIFPSIPPGSRVSLKTIAGEDA